MKKLVVATIGSLLALLVVPTLTSAHERQQFRVNGGVYEFTIGSLNEPIAVDDKTGLFLSVREIESSAKTADEDHHSTDGAVSGLEETLKVELIAGSVKKTQDIAPIFGMAGQYQSPFYPTLATTYSYRIFGTINETPIDFTTSCTPAGHARGAEDKTEVKVNDQVTRILKTGGFGCPGEKANLGFPEKSDTLVAMRNETKSSGNWGMAGTGLATLSLLVAGYAATRRK